METISIALACTIVGAVISYSTFQRAILFVKLVNIKRKHKLPIIIECYKIH